MRLYEKEIQLPVISGQTNLLDYFRTAILEKLPKDEIPVRFVITCTDEEGYNCELGILTETSGFPVSDRDSIFKFKKRKYENTEQFNAVLLVPTGIGAEIGGDSGDAGPVARLLASACDDLITHPNVVNASDINELPENGLYVEGSIISRFMMGTVGLQKVRSNRVLLVIDKSEDRFFYEAAVNSTSAARAAFGLDCPDVIVMDEKIHMQSHFSNSGRAVGTIEYIERLFTVLEDNRSKYDAVALSSVIDVPPEIHKDYFIKDMINPWGGVEAMLTHMVSMLFNIPSAHSPMLESREILDIDVGIVDPRKAAEAVSTTYLHCILKGLHRSPKIINNPSLDSASGILTIADISCLVIPDKCMGLPTLAALEQGIPVIAVRENKNQMQNRLEDLPFPPGKMYFVDNYLEAVGIMEAIKAGVAPESVRRPLRPTKVSPAKQAEASLSEIPQNKIDVRKPKE